MGSIGRRSTTASDVQALKDLLSGTEAKVLVTNDEGYSKSIERWSVAAQKPAGIAIVPTSTEEVAKVIKYAADQNLDVAVRGGGHSTAGASSTDGGLLIDLHSSLRKVTVDPETRQIRAQGGCIWRDVNEAAWEHRLAVVGGGVDDTGVGGLTLGGGYGLLSPQQGLTIDQLLEATVVLATEEIMETSEKKNPDLFWAIRGAGQNFGVVTEFLYQGHPQDEAYVGTFLFAPTPENITKVVGWCNDMYEIHGTPEGPKSKENGRMFTLLLILRIPQAGNQTLVVMLNAFNGTEAEGKVLLQPLFDAGPLMQTMKMQPYPVANQLNPVESGRRVSQKGSAFKVPIREEFFTEMFNKLDTFTAKVEDASSSGIAWEFFNPSKVVASDKGCFANRGWVLNGLIMPQWLEAANDNICRQFARDLAEDFKKELERSGEVVGKGVEGGAAVRGSKGAVMLYGNYDQYDEKSKDIFGEHYPRLQKLKTEYDPTNMFNKLFPIQPA